MADKKDLAAIAECKALRKLKMCERECSFWHPAARSSYPATCKTAKRKELRIN